MGDVARFAATAFGEAGELPGAVITWSSSDTTVARVTGDGLVTGVGAGSAEIRATAGGVYGSAALAVTLRPVASVAFGMPDTVSISGTMLLAATPRDSAGFPLNDRTALWWVSDTTKAVVTMADGRPRLAPRAPGGIALTVTVEGRTAGAFTTIVEPVLALELPDTVALTEFDTIRVAARQIGAAGRAVMARRVTYSIDDASVAVVTGDIIAPRRAGTTIVRASCCGGLTDTAVLAVKFGPADGYFLVDVPFFIYKDSTASATATLQDASGRPIRDTVILTSTDSTILQVVPTGPQTALVRGLRPGLASVVARHGDRTAGAGVRVGLPPFVRLEPETVAVGVGDNIALYGTVQNEFGVIGLAGILSLVIGDTSVAGRLIDREPYLAVARAPGQTTIVVQTQVDGRPLADTSVVVVRPAANMRLAWDRPQAALDTDAWYRSSVTLLLTDSTGQPLDGAGDVTLESSDTSIVTVSPAVVPAMSGQATISIQTLREGTATVTARLGAVAAVLWVKADFAATIVDMDVAAYVLAGDSAAITLTRTDGFGANRVFPVTWTVSDTALAVVRGSWLVARRAGTVRVDVRGGTGYDSAFVVIRSRTGPVVTAAPRLFIADSAAALSGTGFDPVAARNIVTIDGVPVTVTAATDTRLDLRLPAPELFPCRPTGRALLAVTTIAGTWADTVLLSTAEPLRLPAAGDMSRSGSAARRCYELIGPATARYIVSVANASTSRFDTASFTLRGLTSVVADPPAAALLEGARRPDMARWRAQRERHLAVLDDGLRFSRTRGNPAALLGARSRPQLSVADSIGALVRFRVPNVDRPDFCASYQPVTARRVAVTQRLMVFIDTATAGFATIAAAAGQLAAEFDAVMWPLLVANFGDPLAMDSLLDRNQRLTLLISPRVGGFAAGFTTSCDFYPESVAPSSNTGETIYLFAPASAASDFPGGLGAEWRWLARSVLMHEAKHITAMAVRLRGGVALEELWLEEGTATLAEELWSRGLYGTTWRGNATYEQTIYCDVRPGWPACPASALAMYGAFALLHEYAIASETQSPLGPMHGRDASFYGSAWWLVRWAVDALAGDEAAALRALTAGPAAGTANLEAVFGRAFTQMVEQWSMAAYLDIFGIAAPAGYGIASWQSQSIRFGMLADFPEAFQVSPFQPRFAYGGTLTIPVPALVGGAASVFDIEPAYQGRQLLHVESDSPGLTLRIMRLR